ncbi:MAG: right-handed parallel beta-helix repeat-containing protein, partial [Chloroflexota bacterium]
ERTIITNNSPFDQYAAGDVGALSASQRRGLNLFRSAATRCFECHALPTFSTETFRVIGVPDVDGFPHDAGRAAVVASGVDGAFKVPTLRNIALSWPYMHNGIFATLEEVIEFYAQGGGRVDDVENMDPFVQGFELSDQQTEDLIAFLFALTDESSLSGIPESVPSGLEVVPSINNPTRELAATYNIPTFTESVSSAGGQLITMQAGESLQDAADRARPGDTIQIPYSTYNEQVAIDFNDITVLGEPNDAGEWPTFDGQNILTEAITASGNNIEIAFLNIINYTDTGILVEGVTGVYLHDLYVENTGTYGLYPVQSTDVLIENTEVTQSNDAGIYAGQCVNVIVRANVVYGNVLGIEVENTVGAEVYNNYAYDNTVGIFIDLLPQLTSQVSLNTKVYNNILEDNNHENFAKADTAASLMPPGAGIGILAADNVTVYNNKITNHKTAGIGIFHMSIGYDEAEINVGPTPEHILIYGNTFENNGYDADEFITSQGIPGADILWDVSGSNVRIDELEAETFPPLVPNSKWPTFFYNMYWNILNLLISALG